MHLPPSPSARGPLRPPLKPKPQRTLDELVERLTPENQHSEAEAWAIMDRRRMTLRELALGRILRGTARTAVENSWRE